MRSIQITVTDTEAKVQQKPQLTCGMVGLPVEFTFDENWQGLQKTVVFRAGAVTRDVVDVEYGCRVPHELLLKPYCSLRVGIYGTTDDGSLVIPTLWVDAGQIMPGADPLADPSAEPTLPVWQQIQKDMVKSVNGQSPDEKGNVQVKTDKTLSLPNVPAEAAAVGIFFNRMSDRVADLEREPVVFFYCGYPYAAERGMDWDGWIESIYNTEGFFVDRYEDDEGTFYRYHVLDDGGDPIIRCRDGQHAEGACLIEPFGFYGSI